MVVRIVFRGAEQGPTFKSQAIKDLSLMARAGTEASRMAAEEMKKEGDKDIKAAGNFGTRWTEGYHVDVEPKQGALLNNKIYQYHDIPYYTVFEFGAIIRGRPLLWIPLSYTGLTMTAKEYGRRYGLFRVTRKRDNLPLLLSVRDKKPKYFGKTQVKIPKKFHLREIARKASFKMQEYYDAALRRLRGD